MKLSKPSYFSAGGPLFPVTAHNPRDGSIEISTSATMADFFAAHAPAVPDWFELDASGQDAPQPLHWRDALQQQHGFVHLSTRDQDHLKQWMQDGSWDLPEELESYGTGARRDVDARQREIQDQRDAYERDRFFAWRWYYAHQMLMGRPD